MYAVVTFFHPPASHVPVPSAIPQASFPKPPAPDDSASNDENDDSSTDVSEDDEATEPAIAASAAKAVDTVAASKPPQSVSFQNPDELRRKFIKELRQPADQYLASVGLRMRIPDGVFFRTEKDGIVDVLLGAREPGKVGIYLFSVKGIYPPARAPGYLKEYFSEIAPIHLNAKGQSYLNKAGFKNMTLFKGTNSLGEDCLAYFFQNPKTKRSHVLLLKDHQLNRQPARVHTVVDSLRSVSKK
jgi:hypothetical protein